MRDDLHTAAEARLGDRRQRYTVNRRAIVDALVTQTAPATIPDLLRARPELSQSTTYRSLAALEEAGVVRRLAAGGEYAHYELAEHLTEHHHHMICVACGSIEDVTLDAGLERQLDDAFAAVARSRGFAPDGHSIDIEGRCAACTS